jgi:hypothetical protein
MLDPEYLGTSVHGDDPVGRGAETEGGRVAVAVGPAAAQAARHARERGWGVLEAADLERAGDLLTAAAEAGARSALVLAAIGEFPPEAFLRLSGRLCREGGALAVGFAYGRDGEQLLAAVRRLDAPPPPGAGQAALLHPSFEDFVAGTRVRAAANGGSPPTEEVMTAGAGILYLLGHSNGHDLHLGGAVICRRGVLEGAPRPERAFPCYYGAACCYQGRAHRMDADVVSARVAVVLTCWGVSPRTPFSPETSTGEGLAGSGRVRALVTSLRSERFGRSDFLPLYYAFGMGLPAGRAVAMANRGRMAQGVRASLVCYGDPEMGSPATVVDVAAAPDGAGRFAAELPAGPVEVRIALPREEAAAATLAVIEDGPPTGAAWLGEGALFLTTRGKGGRLVFSCASSGRVRAESAGLAGVLDDVAGLSHFCRALAEENAAPPAEINRFAAAVGAAAGVLHRWPLARVKPGKVLSRRQVEKTWASLHSCLGELGVAFLDVCAAAAALGGIPMRAGQGQWVVTGEGDSPLPCGYCGSVVVEDEMEFPLTRHRRRSGNCFCCGTVFVGDPDTARILEVEEPLRLGRTVEVRIPVRNPYPVAVEVGALTLLGGFDSTLPQPSGRSTPLRLAPGGTGTVTVPMGLDPAGRLGEGMYYLSGAVMVGARLTFLRRPVEVR